MELLVVAVKAYDLDSALGRIAPEALAGAVVLPLLNGLEHVEAIRARLRPSDTVVVAGSIGARRGALADAWSRRPALAAATPS